MGTRDFLGPEPEPAAFIDRDLTALDAISVFFAPLAPASSLVKLPELSFFAIIRLILARLAAVSRGKPTELILALPFLEPAAPAGPVLGKSLALDSVIFFVASASSFLRRSSRWALSLAEMASPGSVKVDLVGGLADLEGTKPGREVESCRAGRLLVAGLVVVESGATEVDALGAFAWVVRRFEVEARG